MVKYQFKILNLRTHQRAFCINETFEGACKDVGWKPEECQRIKQEEVLRTKYGQLEERRH